MNDQEIGKLVWNTIKETLDGNFAMVFTRCHGCGEQRICIDLQYNEMHSNCMCVNCYAENYDSDNPMTPEEVDEYTNPEACPGCGCLPGEGRTNGCDHPDGCGFTRTLFTASTSTSCWSENKEGQSGES